jgi:hypothetical protein
MPGRNDPCPCGSGKKYKHCCRKQDLEAERAQKEAERAERNAPTMPWLPAASSTHSSPLNEEMDEEVSVQDQPEPDPLDAIWEAFKAAKTIDQKIAIYTEAMEAGDLDAELSFEMIDQIYTGAVASGERDRFDALVARLRERMPEVYAEDAVYYVDWLISNALAAGRVDDLPTLAEDLAGAVSKNLDYALIIFDKLAYHGQLATLASVMRRSYPSLKSASGYFEWAIQEFAGETATMVMLDYLERTPEPTAADLDALGVEFDVRPSYSGASSRFLAHITGQADRRWTLDDFDDLSTNEANADKSDATADDGRTALYYLTVDFLGYLRRQEGVSYAKGEMARHLISQYLVERAAGELHKDGEQRKPKKRKGKEKRASVHPLAPDYGTLDRFMGKQQNFFHVQIYKVICLFEMIPVWLRFLETRGLLDADQREETLRQISGLLPPLSQLLQSAADDPALHRAMEGWRQQAGLDK